MVSRSDLAHNRRYSAIFKKLVEIYVETGEAVGSRSLSKALENPLSPATIRNVMADLEELGILCSEHTSAGRKPTEKGWRFFVNTLVESANISELEVDELAEITKDSAGKSVEDILEHATDVLSELANCASLIRVPTVNSEVRHIDFVLLSPGRAIVVIVNENGVVENRLIEVASDISSSVLERATRYINSKLSGSTLDAIREELQNELDFQKEGLDEITKNIVEQGLGFVADDAAENGNKLIVKGRSKLVSKAGEILDLEELLRKLDEKKTLKDILDKSVNGQGVQIFIGAETKMFEMSGCSLIVSPYKNKKKSLVGAIGVIGPSRMSYSRVITLVDYTAKLLGSIV
ncbi:MAG: heat-inducible transcription repressor HrcA [Alphaproteobacteria bacterium]|nr:heat-inducible transcription repressor HrcA [Alphaproteobacteria bacterium]